MTTKKRVRSPNFPVVGLESALDYVDKLFELAGPHFVPVDAVIKDAWEMRVGSTYGQQIVGALNAFCLIDTSGSGSKKKIKISDVAAKIRGNHSDRPSLLKDVARSPKIHGELWEEFSNEHGMPPPATLRQYLLFDRDGARFNESSVDDFIEEFNGTLAFAGLSNNGDSFSEDTPNNETGPEDSPNGEIKVGSLVQWTSNGQWQFEKPLPISRVDDKDGEQFAYFEGKGHVPMSQLSITRKESNSGIALIEPSSVSDSDTQAHVGPEVRFPLDGGANEVVIRLKKPVSKKDFDRITKLLELSEDSLVDQG